MYVSVLGCVMTCLEGGVQDVAMVDAPSSDCLSTSSHPHYTIILSVLFLDVCLKKII